MARLSAVVAAVPILPVDGAVAPRYGEVRRASARAPSNDLWIAATALAHDIGLVTRDQRLAALPMVRAHLIS